MHIGLKIFIWGVLGLVVFGALLFGQPARSTIGRRGCSSPHL
ncbi:Conserved integral membrane protein of uncharacterised function [Mycobacterium tuberculosis]|nr:Conserved integral membrane protein of uncharacterised function [Mycobacterium tuberculosis]CKN62286.1 Conserved integral membrane protein of uncharacterised function [Mycobacterium tuberculosis]CKP17007.1 Conserved integral membrane protein of uncharacterised function [Mycobacterium tuberculosis]